MRFPDPYDESTYDGTCSECKSDITIAGGVISGYSYATKACYGKCKNQNEVTTRSLLPPPRCHSYPHPPYLSVCVCVCLPSSTLTPAPFCTLPRPQTYLQASVASYGAPSVCVDASSWNDYTGGVMTPHSCSKQYGKLVLALSPEFISLSFYPPCHLLRVRNHQVS